MSKPAVVNRGRRYTQAEKIEILNFVDKINREKGKGGQKAAQQKFGLSPLTLKNWIHQRDVADPESSDVLGKTLSHMRILAVRMEQLGQELEQVRGEFDKLKKTL